MLKKQFSYKKHERKELVKNEVIVLIFNEFFLSAQINKINFNTVFAFHKPFNHSFHIFFG